MSVEVLLENIFTDIGEGPHWDEATQTLYFVDNIAQRVFSWNYKTKEVQKIQLGKLITGAVADSRQKQESSTIQKSR